jgi:hypothetical protein
LRPDLAGEFDWIDAVGYDDGRDEAIAAVRSYADESGIHEGASHCCIVGLIGKKRQWEVATRLWSSKLHEEEVRDFHAKNLFAPVPEGDFKGWSNAKRHRFAMALVKIIRGTSLRAFGAAVDVPAFHALPYGARRYITGASINPRDRTRFLSSGAPSRPYFCCLAWSIGMAIRPEDPSHEVHFVFDQQKQYAPLALEHFREAQELLSDPRRGTIAFGKRKNSAGLQMADLLAHCAGKWLADRDGCSDDVVRVLRGSFPDGSLLLHDQAGLDRIVRQAPEDALESWYAANGEG